MPSTALRGGDDLAARRLTLERQIVFALAGMRMAAEQGCEEMRDVHEAQMNRLLERWRP